MLDAVAAGSADAAGVVPGAVWHPRAGPGAPGGLEHGQVLLRRVGLSTGRFCCAGWAHAQHGKKIDESAAELDRGSGRSHRIESLFDRRHFLEQVFVIVRLAGTISVSTSQAEAP